MVINEIIKSSKAKNNGRRYSYDWLLFCLLLHIRGPKTYRLLRDQNILPLPCKSTILKYLKKSNVGVGFDKNFFTLFGKQLATLSEYNKNANHGMLCFDEMQVKPALDVNLKTMTFDGLVDYDGLDKAAANAFKNPNLSNKENALVDNQADHILVLMFTSFSCAFNQPIGVFAAKGATKSSVLALLVITGILAVEQIGGKVHGLVCDGAKPNRGLWDIFGVKAKVNEPIVCSFDNPAEEVNDEAHEVSKRKIFIFSDVPHLFKCIRNRLYTKHEFKINDKIIKWEYYKTLYEVDNDRQDGKRICPKLTHLHVAPENTIKMRVHIMAQLFSNQVATGMETYKIESDYATKFEGCEETIVFTKNMNELFDVLNNHQKTKALNLTDDCNAFKVLEKHLKWLDDWENQTISDIKKLEKERDKFIKDAKDLHMKQQQLGKQMLQTIKSTYDNLISQSEIKYLHDRTDDAIKMSIAETEKYKKERDIAINKEKERQKEAKLSERQILQGITESFKKKIDHRSGQFLSNSTSVGLRMTISSTIQLSRILLNSNILSFVLTRKLNQDCLERFFGNIRQAGAQNDHPDICIAMRLYNLLSTYKLLKPPQFGNCRAMPLDSEQIEENNARISFKDFLDINGQRNLNETYKSYHVNEIRNKIKYLIKTSKWMPEDNLFISEKLIYRKKIDQIIYSNCGFFCRRMLETKFVQQCETCVEAFSSRDENSVFPISNLIQLRTKGKLIYADFNLFWILNSIDEVYSKNLTVGNNVYNAVIQEIEEGKIQLYFPCDAHKIEVISELIYYYVLVNMWQYRRNERKNKINETRKFRKLAKLT